MQWDDEKRGKSILALIKGALSETPAYLSLGLPSFSGQDKVPESLGSVPPHVA